MKSAVQRSCCRRNNRQSISAGRLISGVRSSSHFNQRASDLHLRPRERGRQGARRTAGRAALPCNAGLVFDISDWSCREVWI